MIVIHWLIGTDLEVNQLKYDTSTEKIQAGPLEVALSCGNWKLKRNIGVQFKKRKILRTKWRKSWNGSIKLVQRMVQLQGQPLKCKRINETFLTVQSLSRKLLYIEWWSWLFQFRILWKILLRLFFLGRLAWFEVSKESVIISEKKCFH